MRIIKLHFPDGNHLNTLLQDKDFNADIYYLSPYRIDSNNVVLFDPVTQHSPLDTEMVVLSKFARAIKKLIFPTTDTDVEFLNPFLGQQKGGLIHDKTKVIDTTDLERASIDIKIRQV